MLVIRLLTAYIDAAFIYFIVCNCTIVHHKRRVAIVWSNIDHTGIHGIGKIIILNIASIHDKGCSLCNMNHSCILCLPGFFENISFYRSTVHLKISILTVYGNNSAVHTGNNVKAGNDAAV